MHLGLVDAGVLADSVLSAVDDLGWGLDQALDWRRSGPGGLRVRVAGPFLTAPGGYPCDRPWAPAEAIMVIENPETAATIVNGLVDGGVDMIKVVLHSGMPLLGDHELAAVVHAAHRRSRPVVAHAEGDGQAARALAAGVDILAHTPWTEWLPDALVVRLSQRMIMISSLAIHAGEERAYAIAVDNLTRFHAAGGVVRYGTDLGNGARPPRLDPAELVGLVDAGLGPRSIIDAIATVEQLPGWRTWSPYAPPDSARGVVDWFATVRRDRVADQEGSRP